MTSNENPNCAKKTPKRKHPIEIIPQDDQPVLANAAMALTEAQIQKNQVLARQRKAIEFVCWIAAISPHALGCLFWADKHAKDVLRDYQPAEEYVFSSRLWVHGEDVPLLSCGTPKETAELLFRLREEASFVFGEESSSELQRENYPTKDLVLRPSFLGTAEILIALDKILVLNCPLTHKLLLGHAWGISSKEVDTDEEYVRVVAKGLKKAFKAWRKKNFPLAGAGNTP